MTQKTKRFKTQNRIVITLHRLRFSTKRFTVWSTHQSVHCQYNPALVGFNKMEKIRLCAATLYRMIHKIYKKLNREIRGFLKISWDTSRTKFEPGSRGQFVWTRLRENLSTPGRDCCIMTLLYNINRCNVTTIQSWFHQTNICVANEIYIKYTIYIYKNISTPGKIVV